MWSDVFSYERYLALISRTEDQDVLHFLKRSRKTRVKVGTT